MGRKVVQLAASSGYDVVAVEMNGDRWKEEWERSRNR